jgi:hypothetical protein
MCHIAAVTRHACSSYARAAKPAASALSGSRLLATAATEPPYVDVVPTHEAGAGNSGAEKSGLMSTNDVVST